MSAVRRMIAAIIMLAAALSTPSALAQDKRIAFSFDDVPRAAGTFFTPDERSKRLITAMQEARVEQAVFFINPARIGTPEGAHGAAHIAAYVAAGHVIANHSNTHIGLGEADAETYLSDIDAAEVWLAGRPGHRPWFRFPYLHEGGIDKAKRDAVRAGLAARGLRNGYVTADGSDWWLDDQINKAVAEGKALDMEQLRRLFVRMHVSSAEAQDDLARKVLGRSPAHVLLMHETDVTAKFLPDLVAELRRNGWEIISADEAYADQLASEMPDTPNARGDLISALAVEKGVQWPIWPLWIYPDIAEQIFNSRIVKQPEAP